MELNCTPSRAASHRCSIQIGSGSAQRSRVQQLVVDFDAAVSIDPGAFQLQHRLPTSSTLTAVPTQFTTSTTANGGTRATITFSGPLVNSVGSLADGNYLLTVLSANVRRTSDNAAFDGDGDGQPGGNYVLGDDETDNFFALYGDTNGDRLVGVAEFGEFRSTFGRSSSDSAFNSLFDFEGDAVVGVSDFGQFRSRFGKPKFQFFEDQPAQLDFSRSSFSSRWVTSSPWARVTYDTTATKLTVTVNAKFDANQAANNIGVYLDGVFWKAVSTSFAPATQGSVVIDLPPGQKRVTLQNGPANWTGGANIEGSYIQSVSANRMLNRVVAPNDNTLVLVGDSIAIGASATNLHEDGWGQRLRKIGQQVAFESYGARSLYEEAVNDAARSASVQRLVEYSPSRIWIALGTNDWGARPVVSCRISDRHASLPASHSRCLAQRSIYVQSPLIRQDESQVVNGQTVQDFRNASQNAVTGLSYVTFIDGLPILQLPDLADGVHPASEGHQKIFNFVRSVLGPR